MDWQKGSKNINDINSQDRQSTCKRNIEPRSCNHCYGGTLISITYTGCVSVALGIQHIMRMSHTVICGLSGSTIYIYIPHYLINDGIFERKSY